MDIKEINDEIWKLERGRTNYAECQKLAILYIVKNGLQDGLYDAKDNLYSYAPEPEEIKENYILGEFGEVFENAPHQLALDVLEEHMQLIKAVYPKEYAEVIRRLKS